MIQPAMPSFSRKKNQSLKLLACFMSCLFSICGIFAQDNQRLPDSVSTDDTISFEKKSEVESTVTAADSAEAKPDVEDTATFRAVPSSVINAYKKDKAFAYANDPRYWAPERFSPSRNYFDWLGSKWFRTSLIIVLVAVILFALYKIISENSLYLFYSAPKKVAGESTDNIEVSFDGLDDKIREATDSGNYRLALRYMYLKTLKKAGDKQLIRFHADGTNQEYINQMRNHPGENDFRFLTNVYEYVWYGEFPLTAPQFASLQTQFSTLYNIIDR